MSHILKHHCHLKPPFSLDPGTVTTRELINEMRKVFEHNLEGLKAPTALRIAGTYENKVKYFHKSDAELADQVKKKTENFFKDNDCRISELPLELESDLNVNRKEGEIELWIHHSCN